jgi:hypothetical protein
MGKKSELSLAIDRFHQSTKKMVAIFREAEALLENPEVSPTQKRRIRFELEKIPWYPHSPKTQPKRRKSSIKVLSQATYLKNQAKLYEAGGRNADARRIRAEASKLETEGKRLRDEEANDSN